MNLVETIERKRQEFKKKQEELGIGTFPKLRDLMKKQQMEALAEPKKKEIPNAR